MQQSATLIRIAAALIIGFGAIFILATHPVMDGLAVFLVDLMMWPLDGAQSFAAESRFLAAVGGGVMIGWGVMIWLTASTETAVRRRLVLVPLWCWFVTDSIGSVLSGVSLNVAGNLVFLALILAALRRGPSGTAPVA